MTKKGIDEERQLAIGRSVMDRHRQALSALASDEGQVAAPDDFRQQIEIARERMKKYEVAYRALAKS